ncbi:hypothetical protein LAZ67_12002566 [Cordylochernes scorpioides]|uniref:Uncharacterized protein n=1 Tax=Cordylochernes scorpioides TaxID=51811 RepID=A0ABY6L5U5_9ARAC|nr:hypothetical protein LAZ67_12002566 [Cordylochernes scorpioides]
MQTASNDVPDVLDCVRSGVILLIKGIGYPLKVGECHRSQHIINVSLGRHSALNANRCTVDAPRREARLKSLPSRHLVQKESVDNWALSRGLSLLMQPQFADFLLWSILAAALSATPEKFLQVLQLPQTGGENPALSAPIRSRCGVREPFVLPDGLSTRPQVKVLHQLQELQLGGVVAHNNLILQHDNDPAHNATMVKNTIKDLGWELLPHPPYSPDLAPDLQHVRSQYGRDLQHVRSQYGRDLQHVRSQYGRDLQHVRSQYGRDLRHVRSQYGRDLQHVRSQYGRDLRHVRSQYGRDLQHVRSQYGRDLQHVRSQYGRDLQHVRSQYGRDLQHVRSQYGRDLQHVRSQYGRDLQHVRSQYGRDLRHVRSQYGRDLQHVRSQYGRDLQHVRSQYGRDLQQGHLQGHLLQNRSLPVQPTGSGPPRTSAVIFAVLLSCSGDLGAWSEGQPRLLSLSPLPSLLELNRPRVFSHEACSKTTLLERLYRRIVYRDIAILEGSLGFDTAVESWSQSLKM